VSAPRLLAALAGGAARRPRAVLALSLVLGLGGAVLALGLKPTAATDSFVGRSSSTYKATQRFYQRFGEEPVEVLVKGNLQQLVLSSDIERLLGLEGCLSGNVPAAGLPGEGGVNGPCGQLARLHTVRAVIGPGTFIYESASQLATQLKSQEAQAKTQAKESEKVVYRQALAKHLSVAEAHALAGKASKVTLERFAQTLLEVGLQYDLTSAPSIENANFVSTLVFDHSAKIAGTPKERFAYLFPSREAALVSVRLKAGLSDAARKRTIAWIKAATTMPQWRLQHGESYLLTGEPVIVSELAGSISHSIELLLLAVLIVMGIVLSLIFSGRPRLLPLAIAALATALTFGALALVGASLTVASVAVLPVLVGLAVDYAIQFQSRVREALDAGGGVEVGAGGAGAAGPGARVDELRRALVHAATVGAPTIATAVLASAGALLVLLLSPVPQVRGFGLLLVVGLVIAFLCALSAGSAVLALGRSGGGDWVAGGASSGRGAVRRGGNPLGAGPLGAAWRGARELLLDNALTRLVARAALIHAVRRPGRVLAVGLALALLGWGLDTQTRVETDITKLVPQSLPSLRNLNTLEQLSGVGGEIDLLVSSPNVATPKTIEWMSSYESGVLKRFGYSSSEGCGRARLCPAFSLPDLFQKTKLSQREVNELLGVIPSYFAQEVITPDRRTATLAFGIKLMALSDQQSMIEAMRASLHPPRGVSAQLVGLPVLAAQSGTEVASPWRRLLTLLAGLLVVALVLLAVFRGDRRRVLVPLIPIALASGWSALILFAIRVPLNPMSVTLGALVIAISTEFSVLLSERQRQERLAGYDTIAALRRAYRHTGAAVAASGVTAIMGFGVLVLSDIRMLRDFGLVTLVDLAVALIGVLVVLPAALLFIEGDRHESS
jgi:uncharacterized protein